MTYWRFVVGLLIGLALGAAVPALATTSGAARGGAFSQLAQDEIDGTFTTTSTTFVDITGISASATANASERWLVEARFSYRVASTAAGPSLVTRAIVDGTTLADLWKQEISSVGNEVGLTFTHTMMTQALTAGSRTVDFDGRVTASTGSWFLDAIDGATCEVKIHAIR